MDGIVRNKIPPGALARIALVTPTIITAIGVCLYAEWRLGESPEPWLNVGLLVSAAVAVVLAAIQPKPPEKLWWLERLFSVVGCVLVTVAIGFLLILFSRSMFGPFQLHKFPLYFLRAIFIGAACGLIIPRRIGSFIFEMAGHIP